MTNREERDRLLIGYAMRNRTKLHEDAPEMIAARMMELVDALRVAVDRLRKERKDD